MEQKEIPNNSKLISLNPTLHSDDAIQSDARLTYTEFLYTLWCEVPNNLPRKHWVTRLIVKHHHEFSTALTLCSVSTRFGTIAIRKEITEWEREHMMCHWRKAKATQQIIAPLLLEEIDFFTQSLYHNCCRFWWTDYDKIEVNLKERGVYSHLKRPKRFN